MLNSKRIEQCAQCKFSKHGAKEQIDGVTHVKCEAEVCVLCFQTNNAECHSFYPKEGESSE